MNIRGIFDAELILDEGAENEISKKGTTLIFPGGGYQWLSDRESQPIVRALREDGRRGVIVRYDTTSEILGLRPLKQAAWAVAAVKALFPGEPVYLMGFSAGAHCAGSLGVHYDDTDWNGAPLFEEVREFLAFRQKELAERQNELKRLRGAGADTDTGMEAGDAEAGGRGSEDRFRADAMILSYPVITGGAYAHQGSFERLLGTREQYLAKYGDATEYDRALRWFSLEQQVHDTTLPAFVWQTETDQSVPVQNSLLFANALVQHGVPLEYHIFPRGVHGISLATKEVEDLGKNRIADAHLAGWFPMMLRWLSEVVEQNAAK